jgi:glycosyltransferase involved in cell wall biosynthesis
MPYSKRSYNNIFALPLKFKNKNNSVKILLVHTYYKIRGGEDATFEQEDKLLRENNDVETVVYHNNTGIKGFFQFLFSVWNVAAAKKLIKRIKSFQPSVIHIHNWHFAAGPAIIRAAKQHNIPVVITLQNFRLLCPSASLMNGEKLFLDSIHQNFPWTAVKKGVYRNSILQTFWLAFVVWFHKKTGTWKKVDRFIVLTPFAQNLFLHSSLGLSKKQLVIKPNFINLPVLENKPARSGFLFAGRLTEEKGIKILIEAFSKTTIPIKIAGEGPLLDFVKNAMQNNPNIQYVGRLNNRSLINAMASCEALIFPSVWYEGMPITILESFATATPVIASNLGAMQFMIEHNYNGLHFAQGSVEDLLDKVFLWQSFSEKQKQEMGQNAFQSYIQQYTAEKNKQLLTDIYTEIISKK